jgi:hypothetical protein
MSKRHAKQKKRRREKRQVHKDQVLAAHSVKDRFLVRLQEERAHRKRTNALFLLSFENGVGS